ncbi:lysM domain receptor-like kinase 4 [Magnolia sinica]|uniref:lysM domain receptor-like kinase 4 n=1 Tax=Magnolia sinica TaxID=86752 RepID=UPI00265ACE34|nr:lysM domain receptor-like kinase 4 [Magnolia sinica]
MYENLLNLLIFFCFYTSILNAQQRYSGNSVLECTPQVDNAPPSPSFLYTYNGHTTSCNSFLIFKSHPPFNSIPTISTLMSSNSSKLAHLNNVSRSTTFPSGKEVIVPITCSCSGNYYEADTSYTIRTDDETYFIIANDTYQGLSTCSALINRNSFSPLDLSTGLKLRVPLRCACPTNGQIAEGVKYLLTYSIIWADTVPDICNRFNVSRKKTLDANGFSEPNPIIHPFTTILIPLLTEPSINQTIVQIPPSISLPRPVINLIKKNQRSRKGLRVHLVIGITVGSFLLFLFSVLAFGIHRYRKKQNRKDEIEDYENRNPNWVLVEDLAKGIAHVDRVLKVFRYEELQAGTKNFSPDCRIDGSVYRGVIGGTALAIKRKDANAAEEIKILNRINHFNLISLYGVCTNGESYYLVYEYMENGSLKDWICEKIRSREHQSWTRRIQIALDVANGLHYLHKFTKPAHVHKLIKSSNILLNQDLRAKIANFSLARSETEQSGGFELTRHVVGTVGYVAPEYSETGLVSPKLDIYAFGVVMLELITGKHAVIKRNGADVPLSKVLVSASERGEMEAEIQNLVDPTLPDDQMDLALGVGRLSVACLKRDPMSRPCMGEVVSTLSKFLMDSKKWEFSDAENV